MTTGFRNSSGVDFDSLFDPYVQGASPSATGYRLSSGVDLAGRYAPISFGTKGPDVGFRTSAGLDVSNLWAAYGTASYSLPINGHTYTQSTNITSGSGYSQIGFRIVSGTTWQVYGHNSQTAATTVFASGAVPSGATSVKYTWGTYTISAGLTDAGGGVINGAESATSIASNPVTYYQTGTNTSTSGSKARNYPFAIDFYNGGGSGISHTNIHLVGDTEGSV